MSSRPRAPQTAHLRSLIHKGTQRRRHQTPDTPRIPPTNPIPSRLSDTPHAYWHSVQPPPTLSSTHTANERTSARHDISHTHANASQAQLPALPVCGRGVTPPHLQLANVKIAPMASMAVVAIASEGHIESCKGDGNEGEVEDEVADSDDEAEQQRQRQQHQGKETIKHSNDNVSERLQNALHLIADKMQKEGRLYAAAAATSAVALVRLGRQDDINPGLWRHINTIHASSHTNKIGH